MKKIFTLTFCDTPNYGALLQAFALKNHLQSCGYDCSVINYKNPKRKYAQVSGLKKIRSIVWRNTFAGLFESRKRKLRTENFRKNYLKLGDVYSSLDKLKTLNDKADVFIVGSDQVWNPQNTAYDTAYFLSFAEDGKKRISYAASLGTAVDDKKYLSDSLKYLKKFNAVSVREKSSAESLKKEIGIAAETVIDPVFLLTGNEWIDNLSLNANTDNIRISSKYVLCYVMPGNRELTELIYSVAEKIASEKGLKIITLGKKNYARPCGNEILDGDAGPVEFLQYISNAEYVVTNSFHGTALSVIFGKKFYTLLKHGVKRNARMEELLSPLSLDERIVYVGDDFKFSDEDIDYSGVQDKLTEIIGKSHGFLIEAVEKS